jgi:dTDP-4-dehydrorhamnose 3,5-epimerase-like enzyme
MLPNISHVKLIDLPSHSDSRGVLTSIEQLGSIPIEINRIFYMHHIKENRGGHAHIDTDQVIIPISGSFKVSVFDGKNKKEYFLEDLTKGLYTPRLTFTDLYEFSEGAVCLVLANTKYDMSKSLRNLEQYLNFLKNIS